MSAGELVSFPNFQCPGLRFFLREVVSYDDYTIAAFQSIQSIAPVRFSDPTAQQTRGEDPESSNMSNSPAEGPVCFAHRRLCLALLSRHAGPGVRRLTHGTCNGSVGRGGSGSDGGPHR